MRNNSGQKVNGLHLAVATVRESQFLPHPSTRQFKKFNRSSSGKKLDGARTSDRKRVFRNRGLETPKQGKISKDIIGRSRVNKEFSGFQ